MIHNIPKKYKNGEMVFGLRIFEWLGSGVVNAEIFSYLNVQELEHGNRTRNIRWGE